MKKWEVVEMLEKFKDDDEVRIWQSGPNIYKTISRVEKISLHLSNPRLDTDEGTYTFIGLH